MNIFSPPPSPLVVLTFSCLKKHNIFNSRKTRLDDTSDWNTFGNFLSATRRPSRGSVTALFNEKRKIWSEKIIQTSNFANYILELVLFGVWHLICEVKLIQKGICCCSMNFKLLFYYWPKWRGQLCIYAPWNHSSSRREASVINRECLSNWQMDANSSTSFAFVATASTCTQNRPIQRPTLIAESSVPSLFAFAIDTNCTCNSRWFIEQTGDDRRYIESVSVSRCRQHLRPTDSIGFCTVWFGIFGFRSYGAGSRLWISRS